MAKICEIHDIEMRRKFNSTIMYCQKCLIEKNKALLMSSGQKSSKYSNEKIQEESEPGKRKPPVPWKKKELLQILTHVQDKFCNPYIRTRDESLYGKCICSSGKPKHAGHYYPRSTHNGMRFRVNNIHGQSISSNLWKSGDIHAYKKGLIARHGQSYYNQLERDEQLYKQSRNFSFDKYNVILIGETFKYLLDHKIWVFIPKEFDDWKERIAKQRNRK